MTNLSVRSGSKNDYLILADLETGENNWKAATTVILGFIHAGNEYEQKFKWMGWNKGFQVRPELVDIDSDSVKEILIEEDDSGNQSTHAFVTLWRYLDGQFRVVFQQGLVEGGGVFPYSYMNEYSFIRNALDSKLFDIQFIIDAGVDTDDEDLDQSYFDTIYKDYGIEMPRHVHQEVLFLFNGSDYFPNKEVYDYERVFRLYFEEAK